MGKYINRNPKATGEVTVLDAPFHGGVRTRARTLALQKAAGSYIQLRSRRLVKPTTVPKRQKDNRAVPKSKGANSAGGKVNSENSTGSDQKLEICQESAIRVSGDLEIGDEGSFGENVVEVEGRGRSTRETPPINLIKDPDTITTPGSSTKRAYSNNANYRVQTSAQSVIPLEAVMDAFFTEPLKKQQQLFMEKYNFDPVNDKPLLGRYEWVKIDDTKNAD